jgi:hypothetical protein
LIAAGTALRDREWLTRSIASRFGRLLRRDRAIESRPTSEKVIREPLAHWVWAARRTDPSGRNQRTRLLPWVLAAKRPAACAHARAHWTRWSGSVSGSRLLVRVPLGRAPSLYRLRGRRRPGFVRRFRRCRVGGGAFSLPHAGLRPPHNWTCSFPAPSFHVDALLRDAIEGISPTRLTSPYSALSFALGSVRHEPLRVPRLPFHDARLASVGRRFEEADVLDRSDLPLTLAGVRSYASPLPRYSSASPQSRRL